MSSGSAAPKDLKFRQMSEDDADASAVMSAEAFGMPKQAAEEVTFNPGTVRWGIYDETVLAAKTVVREYESWFGGRLVSTAGIAGVAVAPEYRGTGAAREIMTRTLRAARESGAALTTLFRTAPALYRSLGYEQIAELITGELPTSALARLTVDPPVSVRRATAADMPAIKAVYTEVASASTAMLSRGRPAFPATDEETIDAFTGITLALDEASRVVGYLGWKRGQGYGAESVISVADLLAVSGAAYRALLAQLGSWGSVAPRIRIRTSGVDPIHWHIPGAGWAVTGIETYMLRVLDVTSAITARGWPAGLSGRASIGLSDPVCDWNTGSHQLTIEGGQGLLAPGTSEADRSVLRLGPRGLALLYAGVASPAALRRAGLAEGGDAESDAFLTAAFAGPPPAVLDYF